MRFSSIIFLTLINLVFIGCQKETSFETELDPPVITGGSLVATITKDAVSELSYTYEYNAAGLPSRNIFAATAPGFTADGIFQVKRDAAGKISESTIVLASNLSPGSDTMFFEYKRNAGGKVSYMLMRFGDTTNAAGYDSIVYSYNAAGKIAGYITYLINYGSGLVEPIQQFELTWTGNNVVKSMEYELSGSLSTRKLVETLTFFYDAKPAARVLSEDDFLAGLNPANSLVPCENNNTKYSRENTEDPDTNVITEYKYVYGANGKPVSAEVTTIRPGLGDSKATLTFTYR